MTVELRSKTSKFQAPTISIFKLGLFCPPNDRFFKPGQLSITILVRGLIELLTEL